VKTIKNKNQKGISLMELTVAISMMGLLVTTVIFVYNAQFKLWNEGYSRLVIRRDLSQALELASRVLLQAQTIDDLTESSITFTADLGGGSDMYRLYLYNIDDPEPNPPWTENKYFLRFAHGTVDYGQGVIISSDIAQPLSPTFVMNQGVLSIDLTAVNGEEQVTMRTKIRPRNL
jgi:hypothetical protein